MNQQSALDMIPRRFRAVFGDQAVFGMRKFFDGQLHCVISFDGRLNEHRLAKAVRLTLDAEPILGCRFVRRWRRPYWERRTDLDRLEFLRLVETVDSEKDLLEFMIVPTDPSEEPLIRCLIIRNENDTLCIKLDHIVADAGGLKEYVYLLASIYRRLSESSNCEAMPNLTGRRSMTQISQRFIRANPLSN